MNDLTNRKWIVAKGFLFLLLGVLSSTLLFGDRPTLRTALLMIVSIWAFCRFYYFVFYVIEHYVDADYKFSGIFSLVRYCLRNKRLE